MLCEQLSILPKPDMLDKPDPFSAEYHSVNGSNGSNGSQTHLLSTTSHASDGAPRNRHSFPFLTEAVQQVRNQVHL